MVHLQACLFLFLTAVVASTIAAVEYTNPYYTVDKMAGPDSTTIFTVTGQGIKDTFTFKAEEDQHVYKTDKELVIGNKIYTSSTPGFFKRYFVYVVEGDSCTERTYGFGMFAISMRMDNCAPTIAKIKHLQKTLFSMRFNEDYTENKYTVNKKDNGKGTTVQVLGKGIEDQFIFPVKDSAVVYNSDASLVVGDTVYSDAANSIVLVSSGKCTEKEYKEGKIIQVNSLTTSRCVKIVNDMKKAKREKSHLTSDTDGSVSVSEPEKPVEDVIEIANEIPPTPTEAPPPPTTPVPEVPEIQTGFKLIDYSIPETVGKMPFSNDKVKRNSPTFTVDQASDGKGTVVQVVGKGIKDKFMFGPEEDVSVRKTDKTLVVGDKLYTDKENAITVVYGRMCVERLYKKSKQIIGQELSNEECDNVVYNIKMAKMNIPSENGQNDYDKSTFKVSVDVVGRGIKDKFNLPAGDKTKIFKKDNILLIGDSIFSNNSNYVIEIQGGKCKERIYTHGYKTSETNMNEERCEEILREIAAVKSSGSDKGAEKNNEDFNTKYFSVKKVPFSEFYNQIDVVGNGVKDRFYIPYNQDSSVYERDNILIIGDKLYTDKPSHITKIIKGECKEYKYENGKRVGTETLDKQVCDEIKSKIMSVNKLVLDNHNIATGEGNDNNNGSSSDNKKEEEQIIAEFVESLPAWLQYMISTVPTNKKQSFFSNFGI